MARRNPMNARYQKNTAPAGKTRRSASAAKPKRDNATAVSKSSAKTKAKAKPTAKRERLILHPPTAEYARLRRVWWILLGASVLFAAGSFFLWRETATRTYGNVALAASYALIGAAIYLDFAKIRPVRMRYMASVDNTTAKKHDAEKPSGSSDDQS